MYIAVEEWVKIVGQLSSAISGLTLGGEMMIAGVALAVTTALSWGGDEYRKSWSGAGWEAEGAGYWCGFYRLGPGGLLTLATA